ncbi:MAG TPA: ATP-dependent zinc metalloprotease FtsH [Planctomycetaceae bacterium]|nr:ATP-dependent zinc metalloprotease FtsH [Planctomycetaceae bacterium]
MDQTQPPAPPPPPKDSKTKPAGPGVPPQWRGLVVYFLLTLFLLWFWQEIFSSMRVKTIAYSEFKQYLANDEVTEADVKQDEIDGKIVLKPQAEVSAKPTPAEKPAPSAKEKAPSTPPPKTAEKQPEAARNKEVSPSEKTSPAPAGDSKEKAAAEQTFLFRTMRVDDPKLVEELEAHHVKFVGTRPSVLSTFLFAWILPVLFIAGIWYFLGRRMSSMGQTVMSIGKSKAKLIGDTDTGVTFGDVAGCDESKYELQEVVDFLKNPARYQALGAKIPKGILLVGPPGTGKTLLARAVAGEAHVPFFSISGSDFVEMFVGVGAARVRDLFDQAKKHAPCIIFIDEIDAIGGQRSIHVGAVNDEREQTLNQLLSEMDGFEANTGVLILGATNRPDILDRALLRPGRFDRQVVVDSPDLDGREAILKVHARDKRLGPDANLRRIAQSTAGFSGADLANALNEAALLAARRGASLINQKDLEDAVEKVVAGPERRSRRLDPEQKRRVAFHEVGHALVAAYSEHADPVHKISVVPRGRAALGYTLQLPIEEQFLMTRAELFDRIKGMLGGRAAEEEVFNEISTGAENDLDHATALARQMVCMYGMSEQVGLMHVAGRQESYLPPIPGAQPPRDCSEETARLIDAEVKKLLDDAHVAARAILKDHRDQLDLVADELLKRETLDEAAFNALIGRAVPPERPIRAPEPIDSVAPIST